MGLPIVEPPWYSDEEVLAFQLGLLDDRPTELRAFATSLLISQEVGHVAGLFRRGHLRKKLLSLPDAVEWVKKHGEPSTPVYEELCSVAGVISKAYPWTFAQAAHFVLTGKTPRISMMSFRVERGAHPTATRVVLEVEPLTRPEDVEQLFRQARLEYSGGRTLRRQSSKHMRLAVFGTDRGAASWNSLLERWNKKHPEEGYKQVSDFKRDARRARKRLMFPGGDEK